MEEKIIERVQKMLRLAQSSNQGESEAAMGKVMELLTRHNLSLQEIEAHGVKRAYVTHTIDEGLVSSERSHVTPIITKFFCVKVLTQGARIHILGTNSNVEVAAYIYGYLSQMFNLLWQIYEVRNPKVTAKLLPFEIAQVESNYLRGLANGLTNTLERERSRTEEEVGLVLVKDPDLDAYMWEQFPNTKPPSEEERRLWAIKWELEEEKRKLEELRNPRPKKIDEPKAKRVKMTEEERRQRAQERYQAEKQNKANATAYNAGKSKGSEIRIRAGLNGGDGPRQLN